MSSRRRRRSASSRRGRRRAPLPPVPSRREVFRLRRASARDLPLLVRHRRRMFRAIGRWSDRDLDRHDAVYRRWVVREMRALRLIGWVIESSDGVPAGSGVVWFQPSQPRPGRLLRPSMPYIMSMFTEPKLRGRGVATRLVEEMVREATRRGFRRIFLHASPMGRPVYERLGFVDGNEMRLDLPVRVPGRRGTGSRRSGRGSGRGGDPRSQGSGTGPAARAPPGVGPGTAGVERSRASSSRRTSTRR